MNNGAAPFRAAQFSTLIAMVTQTSQPARSLGVAALSESRRRELQDRTARAYRAIAMARRHDFLRVPHEPSQSISWWNHRQPASEDGISSIAGGMVHHWTGIAFIPNVTLQTALDVSRNYAAYQTIDEEIIRSRVLERDGDTYRILLRLKEGEAGITAVLDVRSRVRYEFPDSSHAFAVSESDEIREVRRAGAADEVLLPPGRDSGYLWRTDVFTALTQTAEGAHSAMETPGPCESAVSSV